jgi:hypothetical protein
MHRLGHSSPAAALNYQHAVSERDLEIARALDELARDQTELGLASQDALAPGQGGAALPH